MTSTADPRRRRAAGRAAALLALWLLTACAPTTQPMGPPVAAPTLAGDSYRAPDGQSLPLRAWLPEGGTPPRAVILALHGFNDYSNAFDAPGRFWAAQGVATYAYDQRGFGQAGQRGIWPGLETLQADLLAAAAAVRARHPGVPLYLLGESMGAAVVLTTLADHGGATQAGADGTLPDGVRGAVLAAPAVWARWTMPFYQRWALGLATWTVPWYHLTPPRGLKIRPSDNIEMLRALGRDPLVIKSTRVDAVYGLTNLMDRALTDTARIGAQVPVLALYGENEQLIPPEPVSVALANLAGQGARIGVYPQGWHMLLRDLQAELVWRDVLAWIDDPAAPLPSGADRHAQVAAARTGAGPVQAAAR